MRDSGGDGGGILITPESGGGRGRWSEVLQQLSWWKSEITDKTEAKGALPCLGLGDVSYAAVTGIQGTTINLICPKQTVKHRQEIGEIR